MYFIIIIINLLTYHSSSSFITLAINANDHAQNH